MNIKEFELSDLLTIKRKIYKITFKHSATVTNKSE